MALCRLLCQEEIQVPGSWCRGTQEAEKKGRIASGWQELTQTRPLRSSSGHAPVLNLLHCAEKLLFGYMSLEFMFFAPDSNNFEKTFQGFHMLTGEQEGLSTYQHTGHNVMCSENKMLPLLHNRGAVSFECSS